MSTVVTMERTAEASPRVKARIAGVIYLICGMAYSFARNDVRGKLVVDGDTGHLRSESRPRGSNLVHEIERISSESKERSVTGQGVHLAQVNIARMKAPLDSPLLSGFVARLDEINALADRSPGFVWRLQTGEGNATNLRPYDDDRILVNMSVWESVEQLRAYVYGSSHRELLRQRREWFATFEGAYTALWWVPKGHFPSVDEAEERLAHLAERGPTPYAFTFKEAFPPDEPLFEAPGVL